MLTTSARTAFTLVRSFQRRPLEQQRLTLTFPARPVVFNPLDGSATSGKLAQIADRNGNAMSLAYDTLGRLSDIVETWPHQSALLQHQRAARFDDQFFFRSRVTCSITAG